MITDFIGKVITIDGADYNINLSSSNNLIASKTFTPVIPSTAYAGELVSKYSKLISTYDNLAEIANFSVLANTETNSILYKLYFIEGITYTLSWDQDVDISTNTRNTPYIVNFDNTIRQYAWPYANAYQTAGRNLWSFVPTFTGIGYIRYWCHTLSVDVNYSDFKIELGPTSTAYTQHTEYNVDLPILRAIPNSEVKDTIEYLGSGKWQHITNIGVIALTGSETCTLVKLADNEYHINANLSTFNITPAVVSNRYTNLHIESTGTIVIIDNLYNSVLTFTNRLKALYTAGTPVSIWYQLETPIVNILTLGDIYAYPEYTYLYTDNEVSPTIELEHALPPTITTGDIIYPTIDHPVYPRVSSTSLVSTNGIDSNNINGIDILGIQVPKELSNTSIAGKHLLSDYINYSRGIYNKQVYPLVLTGSDIYTEYGMLLGDNYKLCIDLAANSLPLAIPYCGYCSHMKLKAKLYEDETKVIILKDKIYIYLPCKSRSECLAFLKAKIDKGAPIAIYYAREEAQKGTIAQQTLSCYETNCTVESASEINPYMRLLYNSNKTIASDHDITRVTPEFSVAMKNSNGYLEDITRNLFDIDKVSSAVNISYFNGVFTATDNDNHTYLGYKIQCIGTSGYISGSNQGASVCYSPGKIIMTLKIVDGTVRIRIANRGKTVEFTISYNLSDLGISVGDTITVAFDVIDITIGASKFKNLMILKGSYTADTLPHYQPYIKSETTVFDGNSINKNNDIVVQDSTTGNLLDLKNYSNVENINIGNSGTITSAVNNRHYCTISYSRNMISIKNGDIFTFSVPDNTRMIAIVVFGNRTNGTTYQEISAVGNICTLTVSNFIDIAYMEVRFNRSPTPFTDTTTVFKKLMLLRGSYTADTLPPYQPFYNPKDKTYNGDSLSKYRDTIEVINGRVIKTVRIGVKVLNGSEGFSGNGNSGNYIQKNTIVYMSSCIPNRLATGTDTIPGDDICSHFENAKRHLQSLEPESDVVGFRCHHSEKYPQYIYFRVARGFLPSDDPAGFIAWIKSEYNKGTPVTIQYPLLEPIVTDITDTPEGQSYLALHTYSNHTHLKAIPSDLIKNPPLISTTVKKY